MSINVLMPKPFVISSGVVVMAYLLGLCSLCLDCGCTVWRGVGLKGCLFITGSGKDLSVQEGAYFVLSRDEATLKAIELGMLYRNG